MLANELGYIGFSEAYTQSWQNVENKISDYLQSDLRETGSGAPYVIIYRGFIIFAVDFWFACSCIKFTHWNISALHLGVAYNAIAAINRD